MYKQTALNSKIRLNRTVILKGADLEECMLIPKAYAYIFKVHLCLEVLVQEGPSVLVDKGRLYLNGIYMYTHMYLSPPE